MKSKISVRDAMTMHPITINVDKSLKECAKLMRRHHVGGMLIVEKPKKIIGILTEKDIVNKLIAKGRATLDINVKEIMETDLITIGPNADIYEAMMLMRDEDVRHLPVVENGKLVGLVTVKDVLRIEPQLFDYVVAKYELREAKKKPLFRGDVGICEICGKLTDKIYNVKRSRVCKKCKKDV